MEFADRILKCVECGAEFVFSSGEQSFFHEKQFTNDPKRCKSCRAHHGAQRPRSQTDTHVNCSECGVETTVPFKPTQGKPVLCRTCFQRHRDATEISTSADAEQASSSTESKLKTVIRFPQTRK